MNRLLALAGIAVLVVACADITAAEMQPAGPGAAQAAELGYHGPIHRGRTLYDN